MSDEKTRPDFSDSGRTPVLREGSPVYLGLDDPSGGHVLHAGIIAAIAQDRWTIEFKDSKLPIRTGDGSLIYYHGIHEFVQRRVQIEEQSKEGPLLRIVLKVIGDVVSVNARQEHRISASDAGLTATLDTEEGCTIQDISKSGLGLDSGRKYSIGQTLDVILRFEGNDFSGRAMVQSIRQLDGDRTRYGLRGVFNDKGGDTLRIGLTRVVMGIHRQHLQRIAGAA
jgi:hypothetical protein